MLKIKLMERPPAVCSFVFHNPKICLVMTQTDPINHCGHWNEQRECNQTAPKNTILIEDASLTLQILVPLLHHCWKFSSKLRLRLKLCSLQQLSQSVRPQVSTLETHYALWLETNCHARMNGGSSSSNMKIENKEEMKVTTTFPRPILVLPFHWMLA